MSRYKKIIRLFRSNTLSSDEGWAPHVDPTMGLTPHMRGGSNALRICKYYL